VSRGDRARFFIDNATHQKYLWKKDLSECDKYILFTAWIMLKLFYIHVTQAGILKQNGSNILDFTSLMLK
jgi:hypothetical protein